MKTILVALLLVSSSVFAQSYGGEWQQRQLQQQQWQQYNQVDPYRQNMQQRRMQQNFLNQQHQNQQNLQPQQQLDMEEQNSPGLPIFESHAREYNLR